MGLRRWLTRGPSMALPSTVQPELVSESMKRARGRRGRSEEHTSELQSLRHLVCRLLLEKKKTEVQTEQAKNQGQLEVKRPIAATEPKTRLEKGAAQINIKRLKAATTMDLEPQKITATQ